MIELGKTLRDAREAKGYTIRQLADITKVSPISIEHLEEENFARLPAPIYGRGHIRILSDALGLDSKPLIEEYMAAITGKRPEKPVVEPVAEPVVESAPPISENPISDPLELGRYLRLITVIIAAVAIITGLFFGLRALYRATTPTTATEPAVTDSVVTEKSKSALAESAKTSEKAAKATLPPRKPQKIPSLYLNN